MRIIFLGIRKSMEVQIFLVKSTVCVTMNTILLCQLIKRQSCHHIEISQMNCSANQLTGFYMIATLVFNELMGVLFVSCLSFTEYYTPQRCIQNLAKLLRWRIFDNISQYSVASTNRKSFHKILTNLPLIFGSFLFCWKKQTKTP